jgi:hypothetical protein
MAMSAEQHGDQAGQDENDVGVHDPLLSKQRTTPIERGSPGASSSARAVAWYPTSRPAVKPTSSIQNATRTAVGKENSTFTATPVD